MKGQANPDIARCGRPNVTTGIPCKRVAGAGTPNTGKPGYACNRHRGHEGKKGADSHFYRHGLSAMVKHPEVYALLAELNDDRDVFNTREHIHLLEAMLIHALNRGEFMGAAKIAVEATKAIQRLHEIEEGRKYVIQITDVNMLIEKMVEIIGRHVPDEYTKSLIAQELLAIQLGGTPKALPSKLVEAAEIIDT